MCIFDTKHILYLPAWLKCGSTRWADTMETTDDAKGESARCGDKSPASQGETQLASR